jgi:hypothetical protein
MAFPSHKKIHISEEKEATIRKVDNFLFAEEYVINVSATPAAISHSEVMIYPLKLVDFFSNGL